MSFSRHVAAILDKEGFPGLFRRGFRRALRPILQQSAAERQQELEAKLFEEKAKLFEQKQQALRRERETQERELALQREQYPRLLENFHRDVSAQGMAEARDYFWYHTIDLGNGLVTPGDYDFRGRIADYGFPESMAGWDVLDVGSATGFFAFEFERRGANVVSVDLPSVADWDLIWSDRQLLLTKLMQKHKAANLEELHWKHLDGPFQFCHRMLGSRVRRCLSRIYDLTSERLGTKGFDLIFLGDILGHLFSPLQALNVLAPLCRRQMIISYSLLPAVARPAWKLMPLISYGGGAAPVTDNRSWLQPNWEALQQMLKRVGFQDVRRLGTSEVLARRIWQFLKRDVIHAFR